MTTQSDIPQKDQLVAALARADLITMIQAAGLCDMSRQAFYDHIERGQLPAPVQVGPYRLYRRADVMEWNANRQKRKVKA
ncbi:helix-turn-helix transcriptional regulator [Zavarzinella formosa]|uniref:helix-turn-helix transcriptional regulator n=1 Tax=Zavarzinella formosa TaxID=360055 RepID=UPI0002E26B6B|nr:hypothetical protein [Zavarzinella formosa]